MGKAALRKASLKCTICVTVVVMVCMLPSCPSVLAAGDANRGSCAEFPGTEASPGFRSFLPDCRAYEMVTPPYKGGQPTFRVSSVSLPMSVDGEHLLGLDFGGFADTQNEEFNTTPGAAYEFSGTSSGWNTEALEPAASLAPRSSFVAASADLSRSLWRLVNQSREGEEVGSPEESGYTFAVRELTPAGLRFIKVGPETETAGGEVFTKEEFAYEGASRDLSHIVFDVNSRAGELWPGDLTREGAPPSLYEYVGTGNSEPVLVGVKNQGLLNGTPHINEGADLISVCGTILGSGLNAGKVENAYDDHGTTYNAVSADGSVVDFTALACAGEPGAGPEVNELYARVNGAETVDVSEPTMGLEGNCESCDESEPKAALFQGASEDGSKVFFLSEQGLLPGAEGENLYEYDFNAVDPHQKLILVAPNVRGVARISEDGSHVYFVATSVRTTNPGPGGSLAHQGDNNFYVYDTSNAHTAFIGALSNADGDANGMVSREVSKSERGIWAHEDKSKPVETTPDGRFMVFASPTRLTSDDTGTITQIFEYDAQAETLVRVSRGQRSVVFPEGFGDNGNASNGEDAPFFPATPNYRIGLRPTDAASALAVSEGGMVVFTSRDPLTPGAVGGRNEHRLDFGEGENVYEYRDGNVYLVSPVDEANPLRTEESRLLGTDESGRDVFFFTADSLTPQDTDIQTDWYDAREGGGFPGVVSPVGCAGEGCQGALSAAPFLPSEGGSAAVVGAGNLVSPVRGSVVRPKSLTRAQKLVGALRVCAKKPRKKRASCVRQARKRYGGMPKAVKSDSGRG